MMGISFPYAIVLVYFTVSTNFSHGVLKTADLYKQLDDHCHDGGDYCSNEKYTSKSNQFHLRLPQMDGKKVGSTQELELIKGTKHLVKTLSLAPPIFEIADFFSYDECDMVMDLALEKGLRNSSLVLKSVESKVSSEEDTFEKLDLNKDGFIDKEEAFSLPGTRNIYVTDEDTLEMFEALGLDQNKDGRISLTELKETTLKRVENYLENQQMMKPRLRSQSYSQQVWLWHDDDELLQFEDLLEDYHDRISQLTRLPKQIIEQSEPVQVVRYKKDGHYHCHHDSEPATPNKPCCLYGSKDCRLCRYLTIMVFLSNVEHGGESAFPIADNATFGWEAWSKDSKRTCNLAKHCDKSNLVVKPHKGKALMWYNHMLDEKNMWFGNVNPLSYHGSCSVRKGEKWIANIWININGDGRKELRAWKMGNNWLADKNQNQEVIDALRTKNAEDATEWDKFTKERNIVENGEERASKIHRMENVELKHKGTLTKNNEDSRTSSVSTNKMKLPEEAFVETLEEIDHVPKGPKLSVTETSSPLPLTEEQMTPQGPPVGRLLPARYEGNRIMQSIMLLLEELDQVELEIIARNLHTKLKLVCVPLIMNPMGSV